MKKARNTSKDLRATKPTTPTRTHKQTKPQNNNDEFQDDRQLLDEFKNLNQKLIQQLREQYPSPKDQKYLGIYEEPNQKRKRKE